MKDWKWCPECESWASVWSRRHECLFCDTRLEDGAPVPCEVQADGCLHALPKYDGDGRFCINCYAVLMPYSDSNRLLRKEYDTALARFRKGVKPKPVHDPVLDAVRSLGGLR